MKRALPAIVLVLVLAATAAAQDVVRLRNGRFVAGTLSIDEADKEGFKVQRWDTGSTVIVRWAQITDAERLRLLNKAPDMGSSVEMIDGVQAITQSREVIGILKGEDANQILIKSKESRTPIPVPKSGLLRPLENRKIKLTDAFSSDELVDREADKASDYASLVKVGRMAAGFKLYERAKEFYQKALAADASKKDEIDPILAQNEVLIKEGKASTLLAEVKDAVENTEYAKATELAKKLLAENSETETAKQNKDLVAQIEREAKDFELKKAEILAQKVPEMYKAKRQALFSSYSGSKFKLIAEARSAVTKIDEEVQKDLAKMLKSTPEEIKTAWEKRDTTKTRTVTAGGGSWILLGGQDGGMDTDQKYTPPANQKNQNNPGGMGGGMGGIGGALGGRGNQGGRNNPQQPAQPVELGKKLETSAQWWATSSQTDKKNFVETEYARTSSAVKKVEEKTKKCSQCQGEGTLKATRGPGVSCDVKCPRCHGAKDDAIVIYG
jgi:tetratricopeptide (TPR) repeat protein